MGVFFLIFLSLRGAMITFSFSIHYGQGSVFYKKEEPYKGFLISSGFSNLLDR